MRQYPPQISLDHCVGRREKKSKKGDREKGTKKYLRPPFFANSVGRSDQSHDEREVFGLLVRGGC